MVEIHGTSDNVIDTNNDGYKKNLAYKDNAPFISCFLKINNTFVENAEDFVHFA